MSSQVVRVQGFSKGSLGAIGKEVEREEKEVLQHRNPDIDISRTHLNKIYKLTKNGMYGEWQDTCKDMNVTNSDKLKKNAIAFEGMVITSDRDFFEKLGYVPGQEPSDKVKEFFDQSYEFAKQEIGFKGTDKNILSAVVHYDETTPHLQLYYIPIVDSWKEKILQKDENGKVVKNEKGSPIQARDGKGKLMWNTVTDSEQRKLSRDSFWKNKGGNTSYTQMQDRFYEQISVNYGLDRGERGSTREHTTKAEWEQQKLDKKILANRKELTLIQKEVESLKSNLEYAKDGSILVPQLASKTKTTDIQEQNKALRLEVTKLQEQLKQLQFKTDQLELAKKETVRLATDRDGGLRKAFDSKDKELIYQEYLKQFPEAKNIMQPFENKVAQAHQYGQELVEHKKGYVDCLERSKTVHISLVKLQDEKSTLTLERNDVQSIHNELQGFRSQLAILEQERSEYGALQFKKKAECDKHIRDLRSQIINKENYLVSHYDMQGQLDHYAITENLHYYNKRISECTTSINKTNEEYCNLTKEGKNHLDQYKSMQKGLKSLYKPIRGIIERYDKEYVPTQEEYKRKLGNTNVPDEKERNKMTLDKYTDLIDKMTMDNKTQQVKQESIIQKDNVRVR